ncbi:MAG TPA: RagB/SusD family nutrient uptake outer membrane protein [Gemmatimonadaceae bacterium]|nr:RagB/SusD family nutrient uptake outer membrane protein [Gemmatimonadaceae bacterium]
MTRYVQLVLGATLTLSLAACSLVDHYLKVTSPEQIQTGLLEQPQNAVLISQGAIGDFECAYGAAIVVNGLVSGELIDGTLTAARWDYDRRSFDETTPLYSTGSCDEQTGPGLGNYTPIQTARHTNDRILQLLRSWTDQQVAPNNRLQLMDTAAVYAGYSRILLGEAMCSAPDSELGPTHDQKTIFQHAVANFSFVIDSSDPSKLGDKSIITVAYSGRARARLDAGDLAGAAADAGMIPVGFEFDATATGSGAHRQNRMNAENVSANSVSIQTAYLNLTVPSSGGPVPDTRVQIHHDSGATAADRRTPSYIALKDAAPDSPMRVASYQEAQLIIAEAAGGSAASVTAINNARAADGLPAYSGPTDAATVMAQVIEERRREMFLEGTRLYDLHRLSLPLDPAPGTSYSTAASKGGKYGGQTCFPLPDVEKFNNPAS